MKKEADVQIETRSFLEINLENLYKTMVWYRERIPLGKQYRALRKALQTAYSELGFLKENWTIKAISEVEEMPQIPGDFLFLSRVKLADLKVSIKWYRNAIPTKERFKSLRRDLKMVLEEIGRIEPENWTFIPVFNVRKKLKHLIEKGFLLAENLEVEQDIRHIFKSGADPETPREFRAKLERALFGLCFYLRNEKPGPNTLVFFAQVFEMHVFSNSEFQLNLILYFMDSTRECFSEIISPDFHSEEKFSGLDLMKIAFLSIPEAKRISLEEKNFFVLYQIAISQMRLFRALFMIETAANCMKALVNLTNFFFKNAKAAEKLFAEHEENILFASKKEEIESTLALERSLNELAPAKIKAGSVNRELEIFKDALEKEFTNMNLSEQNDPFAPMAEVEIANS